MRTSAHTGTGGGTGWTGIWEAPRCVAGLSGLCLDWLSWQPRGGEPQSEAATADLCAIAASCRPGRPRWRALQPGTHAHREEIGVPCRRAWPISRGRFVYAAARLRTAAATRAAIRLGGYLGYRVWLDGRPLMQSTAAAAFALDDNMRAMPLSAGVHAIVAEVDREAWETVFHVRLSDGDGADLPRGRIEVERVDDGVAEAHLPRADRFYGDLINQRGRLALDARPEGGWDQWRPAFRRSYRSLVGDEPAAPRTARLVDGATWRGVHREAVVLDGGASGPVPLWCLRPEPAVRAAPPAVLCIHGHGCGKDDVIGLTSGTGPGAQARIRDLNYDYGFQLAQAGFAVFAPDLRNFGERAALPGDRSRDPCDNNFMKAVMLGRLPLAEDLRDLMAVVTYARSRPEVEASRLGCVGLSLGGRMAMYLAALDERIGAVVSSGALNTLAERLTSSASCGAQLLPGLWRYGDTPEVFGLIAPRPLLLELGTQDDTSPEVFAADAYRRIRQAYRMASAEDRLQIDVFARGHRFSGRLALDFLNRHLRP